jgi:hypothetical protein
LASCNVIVNHHISWFVLVGGDGAMPDVVTDGVMAETVIDVAMQLTLMGVMVSGGCGLWVVGW